MRPIILRTGGLLLSAALLTLLREFVRADEPKPAKELPEVKVERK
jgi:hypothetical protein